MIIVEQFYSNINISTKYAIRNYTLIGILKKYDIRFSVIILTSFIAQMHISRIVINILDDILCNGKIFFAQFEFIFTSTLFLTRRLLLFINIYTLE